MKKTINSLVMVLGILFTYFAIRGYTLNADPFQLIYGGLTLVGLSVVNLISKHE